LQDFVTDDIMWMYVKKKGSGTWSLHCKDDPSISTWLNLQLQN